MIAGLPYTALRDAVLTHPTLVEVSYLCSHPRRQRTKLSRQDEPRSPPHEVNCHSNAIRKLSVARRITTDKTRLY